MSARGIPLETDNPDVEACPGSWYALAPGRAIGPRRLEACAALGHDLALWRDGAGSAHVHGRYCPHMGASLARGSVDGDRLRCPFHHRGYDGTGHRVDIPNLEPGRIIPPRAWIPRWPVSEHLGWIWIRHGAGEPGHELPPAPSSTTRASPCAAGRAASTPTPC